MVGGHTNTTKERSPSPPVCVIIFIAETRHLTVWASSYYLFKLGVCNTPAIENSWICLHEGGGKKSVI